MAISKDWEDVIKGPFTMNEDEDDTIDCVLSHPDYGEIPFTANPKDTVEHGRLIHEYIVTNVDKKELKKRHRQLDKDTK